MSHLTVEVIKKSCAFILHVNEPEETMKKLFMFFLDRHILIDSLQMYRQSGHAAMVIIHCQIERDRIARTVHLLEQLPGIMEMERMEGK